MSNPTKVILVTGASSGFGCAIAKSLVAKSYRVYGTARMPGAASTDGFTTLTLDVTQDDSVHACVSDVILDSRRPALRYPRANAVQRTFCALRPFLPQALAEYLIRDAYGLK